MADCVRNTVRPSEWLSSWLSGWPGRLADWLALPMYVCLSACLPSARRTFRNRRFPQLCASLDSIPHSTLRTHCNNRWNIKRRKMLKSLQNVRNSLKCLKCLTSLLLYTSLHFFASSPLLLHPLGWNCAMDIWRQSAAIGLNATAGKELS